MTQLSQIFMEYKNRLLLLGALCGGILLFELCIFNYGFLISKVLHLQERRYSVSDGSLYQFNLLKGNLVAQNNDPNITFDNINLPVGIISIKCINTVPRAGGQVFYRVGNEPFNESNSVQYEAPLADETLFLRRSLGFPKIVTVSSLRFDLTDTPGDSIACSEFVINPHISFELSRIRLAGYVGLLLLAMLIIFRDVKPVLYLKSPKVLYISFFLALSLILEIKLMPLAISQKIVFIVVLCVLLFSFAMTYALAYLYIGYGAQVKKEGILGRYKYEIAIAIVMLITTLPLLTQSYLYYDDYWGIGNKALPTKQSIITFARPIQILIYAVFDYVRVGNAYIFKWVFLPAVILYAIVLYRWLYAKTQDDKFSFFLACLLSVFAPVMDLLGYSATSAVCYSILFSALSIICFEHAYIYFQQRKIPNLLLSSLLTFVLLFVALLTYQIGTQIVFVFLSVDVYFNIQKKSLFKKNLTFLMLFGLSNVLYLLFIKLLNKLYLVELTTNRSQTINSISQVGGKIDFYKSVVTQSIMQVVAAFTGDGFILERYRGYMISFTNQFDGNMLFFFVSAMIFIAFLSYWLRTKNILGLLSLLAFIPMSYFVFLVLSESGYLVYYAFAHISLFMFYFIMGFISAIQFLWRKIGSYTRKMTTIMNIEPSTIIAPLLVVCALVSNYYIRAFYIDFNNTVYSFVKYNLQTATESGNIRRIHVNGTISPINADVYSRFVVETALKDLGEDVTNYVITFSGNRYFPLRIQSEDYLRILEHISEEDKRELDKIYAFGATYGQYSIKTWPSKDDQKKLQQIFMLAGVIPPPTSPDTLIIDLSWTDGAYFNHSER
jgi:hypothetical protein